MAIGKHRVRPIPRDDRIAFTACGAAGRHPRAEPSPRVAVFVEGVCVPPSGAGASRRAYVGPLDFAQLAGSSAETGASNGASNATSRGDMTPETTTLLEHLDVPIRPDAPTGDDPRYDPDHEALRAEVGRLGSPTGGEVDWRRVAQLATAVFARSRDLLAASHYIRGRAAVDGLLGVDDGLLVMRRMLDAYGDALHPRRPRARANAVSWLVEQLAPWLAAQTPGPEERALLESVQAQLRDLGTALGELLGDDAPTLRPLRTEVERLLLSVPEPKPEPAPVEADTSGSAQVAAPAPVVPSAVAAAPIAAAPIAAPVAAPPPVAAPAASEPLAPFLRKTADALLAAARPLAVTDPESVRLWITALFLDLDRLPDVSEGSRTYIPAPRSIVLEELRAAAGDPERLARTARGAAEHAPFAFELHRRYHDALEALGAKDAAGVLRGALRALVARLPGLLDLAFQDGAPFADAAIRSWLGESAPSRASVSGSVSASATEEDDEPVGDDVPSALRVLGERAERARGRRRFTLRRRIAELYVEGRRPALAAAIYADLVAEADALALGAWDPEPLADVLAGYVRALRELASSPDAPHAAHQADEVLARLATVDPSAAFALA